MGRWIGGSLVGGSVSNFSVVGWSVVAGLVVGGFNKTPLPHVLPYIFSQFDIIRPWWNALP